jgi:RNA polymerase sigma-70 factor (ECF subfamily)
MEERPDQALAADMARGDAGALRQLYDRHEVQTFSLILRLAGDRQTAQDLMQETFTRVWTMARMFDPARGSFKGWLFTIALNLTRSELAKKRYAVRHVATDDADELPSREDGPDVLAARDEDGRRVAAALGRLDPLLREVVILKVYHQLKFREIADMTRTPEGTLKARFHRAVAELRAVLGTAARPAR